jgi:hypothetical protein
MSRPIPSLLRATLLALAWLVAMDCAVAAEDADAPRAEGTWQGTLEFPGQRLRLVAHLRRAPDGTLIGTLDSIDQRATGLPLDAVSLIEDVLSFQIAQIGARYAGNFYGEDSIHGVWTQGLNSVPLVLTREAAAHAGQRAGAGGALR